MNPPHLLIRLDLEQPPVVQIVADTYEDEQRLRTWLEHASVTKQIPKAISRYLRNLDRYPV